MESEETSSVYLADWALGEIEAEEPEVFLTVGWIFGSNVNYAGPPCLFNEAKVPSTDGGRYL